MQKEVKRYLYAGLRCIDNSGKEGGFFGFQNLSFKDPGCDCIVVMRFNGNGKWKPALKSGKRVYIHLESYHKGRRIELFTARYDDHNLYFMVDEENCPFALVLSSDGKYTPAQLKRVAYSKACEKCNVKVESRTFLCVYRYYVEFSDGTFGWI